MTAPVLNRRERWALRSIADGGTYTQIAQSLGCSESTAKHIISGVYLALKARNAAHAVHRGHALRLLAVCTTCGATTDGAAECNRCAIDEETTIKRREDR